MYGVKMVRILAEGCHGWSSQERGNAEGLKEVYGYGENGYGSG